MDGLAEKGAELGELLQKKNDAYGDSFFKAGEFLRLLYPDGLQPSQYDDALCLVRIFDKMSRIATDRDAFGESPYDDIAGYGILGSTLHKTRSNSKQRCNTIYNGLCYQPCCGGRLIDECEPCKS